MFVDNMDVSWKLGTIEDLGKVVGGSTPSKAKQEYYTDDGIAWITPKDLSINKSKFINKGSIDITESGFKNSSVQLIPKGTVLFSSRAPIGYIAIADNQLTTNQGFKSIVPFENIGTTYVYCFLKNNIDKIKSVASGSTFKEVSGSVMKSIETIVPNDEVLENFNVICNPIVQTQRNLENENEKLRQIRDMLLPKLMNGQIDVSNINLE